MVGVDETQPEGLYVSAPPSPSPYGEMVGVDEYRGQPEHLHLGLRPLTGKWSGSTASKVCFTSYQHFRSPSPYGEMVGVDDGYADGL